ncbi:bifunctional (p)ppGpp synthetase/guanosine-3',5'-bis(diphosphate) 3'-pyrophosphohydrolase [Candidatus Albibeggiatoa sp. nov. NOAA]|uniref:RelA/SpoT family protein n=1 Tax=Candidatus Albibeggiatoa sp. nov. NOAA TaxID=3162724 RepID=UPI0033004D98|nr:bifunctional (p)ppGpp synthetase/guanosine-3',5'-bis(diphosphate) 3'-pyrophosphohydrolase [Thiotrichaceae bacterium]
MSDSPPIGPPRLYINDLCQLLESYLPQEQVQEVYRAYVFAEEAHKGQVRRSGEDFIHHPIAVAYNLAQFQMDMEALSAALLHDVIEDTGISKQAMIEEFGETVTELVDGVSKLNRMEFETREQAQAASFRKMVLAMSRDIRVIIIKLADRLHNIRTIGVMKPASRRRIARETLDIYAPIASRLGMNNVRLELEDLSFAALYPLRYKTIKKRLARIRDKRDEHFKSITEALTKRLETYHFPYLEIQERDKYPYTIYKKIRESKQLTLASKYRTFQQITRSYGFRVITDSVDNCYRALGGVHSLYKPVLGCFSDHIAIPKLNGYQSLHTIVLSAESGQQGQQIEVHIRTQTMHELTEYGVAAYGLYNRLDDTQNSADIEHTRERATAWIKSLVDMQKNVEDSLEFINHVKSDLLPEEVYVFTPKGQIQQLPKGATGLDFAYSIHSAVGNRCIAIKIDGQYAPLYKALKSGQTIEVSTAEWARPSPDWLDFVISAKARNHIVHYLKNQNANKAIDLGKRLLSKQLLKYGLFADNVESAQREHLIQYFKTDTWECLLKEIGLGNLMAIVVASHFDPEADTDSLSKEPKHTVKPLMITGEEGRVVTFARCCRPIPGDEVIGYPSAGKGIAVHTSQCKNIATTRHTQPEKFLLVTWSKDIKGEFLVDIQVEVRHERGVLAQISALLADMHVNIESISNENKDGLFSILRLCLAVHNRKHLADIMRALKRLDIVTRVQRYKH